MKSSLFGAWLDRIMMIRLLVTSMAGSLYYLFSYYSFPDVLRSISYFDFIVIFLLTQMAWESESLRTLIYDNNDENVPIREVPQIIVSFVATIIIMAAAVGYDFYAFWWWENPKSFGEGKSLAILFLTAVIWAKVFMANRKLRNIAKNLGEDEGEGDDRHDGDDDYDHDPPPRPRSRIRSESS